MVNTSLPLPILKYLEMEPESIERMIREYPFYIYPRLAQILNKTKSENSNANSLNFFGFHEGKLNQYIDSFKTLEFSPINTLSEENDILVSSEPEVSLHDVSIDIVEESNMDFDIVSSDQVIDSFNSSEKEEDKLNIDVTLPEVDQFNLESSEIEFDLESINKDEETIKIEDDFSIEIGEMSSDMEDPMDLEVIFEDNDSEEELADKISLSNDDELIEIPELGSIKVLSTEGNMPLNIEIDPSDLISDEELAKRLSDEKQEDFIENNTEEVNIEFSSSLESEILPDESTVIELDKLNAEILDSDLDESIHFDIKKETNYIQPTAFELLNLTEEETIEQKDEIPIDKEDEPIIDESNDSSNSNVKDFTAWLTAFSQLSETIKTNEFDTDKKTEEKNDDEELNKVIQTNSVQHLLLETLHENEETPKINRDDELEGVLKDTFFKSQVEIKKASRKTPSELRIQDEAQLSLQPLDLVSETMAILHEKQGNISKAIEIYEKLIALFPEKSSFFALQIENLRK
jgi:hypothetical protein